ncbi:hypothetical protein VNO77_44199 [Canavalia gladiata]|uniref:Uncharacterized protein n=1 Tax=Canavalia gladiata TaxID=3824 RepID=A0AAN9PQS3_CANGL
MVGSGGLGFVISMVSLVIHANNLIQEDEELVRDHYTLGGSCKKPSSPLPTHWVMRGKTLLGLKDPGVQVCKIPSIVVFRNYVLMEFIPTQAVREAFRLEPHAMSIHIVPQILKHAPMTCQETTHHLALSQSVHRPGALVGDVVRTPPGLGFETHQSSGDRRFSWIFLSRLWIGGRTVDRDLVTGSENKAGKESFFLEPLDFTDGIQKLRGRVSCFGFKIFGSCCPEDNEKPLEIRLISDRIQFSVNKSLCITQDPPYPGKGSNMGLTCG